MKQDAWCPIEQAQVVKLNKEISDITPTLEVYTLTLLFNMIMSLKIFGNEMSNNQYKCKCY